AQTPTLAGQSPLPAGSNAEADRPPLPAQAPAPAGPLPLPEGASRPGDTPASAAQTQHLQEAYSPSNKSDVEAGKGGAAALAREMAQLPPSGTQPPGLHQMTSNPSEVAEAQRQQSSAQVGPPMTAATIPDELRPLVQQQLDAAGTQRLMWHGEIWPGQTMQWEIEWNDQAGGNSGHDEAEPWATTLRLKTPRLGEVEAGLRLGAGGVRIALTTPLGASAADLRAGAPALEQALASAGVPVLGFTVKQSPASASAAEDGTSG
ncbi:MAG: flagellar hook-length control protein FliK, partial [Sterolibacterium sp.]